MDIKELRRLKPELESLLDRYAPLFGRTEAQAHARRFVRGLLLGGQRRSAKSSEQDFQNGTGECGLDEYETRGWVGWHHPTALSVLALWFLARQRDRSGGNNRRSDDPRGASRPGVPARPTRVG